MDANDPHDDERSRFQTNRIRRFLETQPPTVTFNDPQLCWAACDILALFGVDWEEDDDLTIEIQNILLARGKKP